MLLSVNDTMCEMCGEAPATCVREGVGDGVDQAFCLPCKREMEGHDEGIREQSALTLHLVTDAARRRLSDDQVRHVVERALAGEEPPVGLPLGPG